MAKKSKLLSALDAHKNRDYGLERQKKLQKAAEKKKKARRVEDGDDDEEEGNEIEEQDVRSPIERMRDIPERLPLTSIYRTQPMRKNQTTARRN
jgi:hypothetical protein